MDLQAELATCLGAKRFAFEQSMEVDEEAWPSDKASEAEWEGEEGGNARSGEKKKEKKKTRKEKNSRTTSKVSQKSTGVWQAGSQSVRMVSCFSIGVRLHRVLFECRSL